MMAFLPQLTNRKIYNEDGVGGMHVYSPWWLDNKKLDFPRGYHIEVWGGMGAPTYGTGFNVNHFNKFFGLKAGGYGDVLRSDMKKYYGSTIGFSGRGESVAMKSNYCEIDPNKVDKYGVPVLRFNYKWTDYEIKQAKHMQDTFEEIIHNMGGQPLWNKPGIESNYGLTKPGEIIHEVGTTRMGKNPKESVVDQYERMHDVDNVFVVDAGPFVSQADKNPTWTIMALAWRASDHIVSEFKKQNF
jgi:choline dehydrogenase-like flavoprotein